MPPGTVRCSKSAEMSRFGERRRHCWPSDAGCRRKCRGSRADHARTSASDAEGSGFEPRTAHFFARSAPDRGSRRLTTSSPSTQSSDFPSLRLVYGSSSPPGQVRTLRLYPHPDARQRGLFMKLQNSSLLCCQREAVVARSSVKRDACVIDHIHPRIPVSFRFAAPECLFLVTCRRSITSG